MIQKDCSYAEISPEKYIPLDSLSCTSYQFQDDNRYKKASIKEPDNASNLGQKWQCVPDYIPGKLNTRVIPWPTEGRCVK